MIMLKWDFKKRDREGWGEDWINLAQDTEKCRVLVNAVTNLRVP
jgi:hypothetical protein